MSDASELRSDIERLSTAAIVNGKRAEAAEAEVERLTAERDGLAKALEAIAAIDYTRGATNGYPYKVNTLTRAALAALPNKNGGDTP